MDKESIKRTRTKERIPCNLEVVINGSLLCKAFDISEGGLFVYTDHSFHPGSIVEVSLEFGGEKLEIKARVKHAHEGVGMGLMFIDLDNGLKSRLKKLVSEIQKPA
jgi:hypothetical protein